jgi:hypothetical protein
MGWGEKVFVKGVLINKNYFSEEYVSKRRYINQQKTLLSL